MLGIVLHRHIERRFLPVGDGDRARDRRAVGLHPARHQPLRRVERDRVDAGEELRALAGDAPQHRVDQAGVTRRAPVGLHQTHREVDGGVVGDVEPQDLRRPDEQHGFDPRRVGRKLEPVAEEMAQRPEPAQHHRHQGPHQRAIALRKCCEVGVRRAIVERAVTAQHAVEDVDGDLPRREAGRVALGCGRALIRHQQHPCSSSFANMRAREPRADNPMLATCGMSPRRSPQLGDACFAYRKRRGTLVAIAGALELGIHHANWPEAGARRGDPGLDGTRRARAIGAGRFLQGQRYQADRQRNGGWRLRRLRARSRQASWRAHSRKSHHHPAEHAGCRRHRGRKSHVQRCAAGRHHHLSAATVAFEPFYANRQAQFDAAKFSWLGTPTTEVAMYIVWHASKIKTLADAQTQEMMAGGAGAASTPAFYGRVFNQLLNMKARLITGYPGQNEILLALENGEVEAMASPFWSSIKTMRPDWYPQSKIRALFQYGLEPHPELAGVPFALDLLHNDADKALLIAASAPLGLGRPFMAPPGIPADRLAALRAGMMATFNDPQFRADCEKQRLECSNPKTGEEIEALIKQAYATPEAIRKRLIDIYQVGLSAEKK